jgi:hypothetical protein
MMRRVLMWFLPLLVLWNSGSVNAQLINYEFCFDEVDNCIGYIMNDPEPILQIDTISNAENIWEIGIP